MNQSNLSRRNFLKIAGTSSAIMALPFISFSCGKLKSRPNILFIMTDDHAFQAISCYGSKINETPNIDRLASEGVRFNNSYCTNAICAPSRAVLLTGKYSHMNGQINNMVAFDGSQQTFPKLLQKAGYQTALVGKWHLESDPTGFDFWTILPGQGNYYNPGFFEMGKKVIHKGYVTDIITDETFKWLDNRNPDKPFCLLLHHKAPHRNWMPGPKYLNKYDDVEIPVPDSFFDNYENRGTAAKEQEMSIYKDMQILSDLKVPPLMKNGKETPAQKQDRNQWEMEYKRLDENQKKAWDDAYRDEIQAFHKAKLKGKKLAEWKYQRYMKDYLRCIAAVDDNIGRVLDYLDEKGLADNTIVVYTSDQGFYLGEHGWFDKRFMYEESFRMPLIVRYPHEITPAVNDKNMVLNLDFAATFLDYAGVEIPQDIQGESMRSILKGEESGNWRKSIYYHYYEYPGVHSVKRHYGIRTARYKLIHFYYDVDEWELYDLEKDPQELNNVYSDAAYASIVLELKKELQQLREKYQDTDEKKYLPPENIKIEHKAIGCPVKLKYPNAPKYNGGGKNPLTNGWIGPEEYHASRPDYRVWLGFEEDDFEAVLDLRKQMTINEISTGFLNHSRDWIFFPESIEYAVSNDGKNFKKIDFIENIKTKRYNEATKKNFICKKSNIRARFIKVKAKNIGVCPEWHAAAGGKAWLFIDEIVVR